MFKRRKSRGWYVQLHRAREEEGRVVIMNSWSQVRLPNLREARLMASRLRQDNGWGGPVDFPLVTITGPDGIRRTDGYYWNQL